MSSDSKGGLLAVTGVFTGLTIISCGLRFVARRHQKAPLLMDDWLVIPALISYLGAAVTTFIMVHDKDLGYASHDFTPEQNAAMLQGLQTSDVAWQIIAAFSLACTKLSALFFYRKVFVTGMQATFINIASIVLIVTVVLWIVVFEFLAGFQCGTHFASLWEGSYIQDCKLSFPFLYGFCISDFLLDIMILVLPIPSIMQLHGAKKKRVSIAAVFLLAFIGLGASIARMVQYIQIEQAGPEAFIIGDEERDLTQASFLAMLEGGMSLVAVNLPSLSILLAKNTPERILRSIRSAISLRSSPSHQNARSNSRVVIAEAHSGNAAKSRASSKSSSSRPGFGHEMPDLPRNKIMATKDVSLSHEHV